jgi:hypothetical protein
MEMTLEVSWERTLSVLFELYFTGYDAYLFVCGEILYKWKNFLIPEIKLELSSIGFDSGKESSSFFCLEVFHISFHSIGFYIFLNFEISTVCTNGRFPIKQSGNKRSHTLPSRAYLVKLLKVLDGQNSLSNNFYSRCCLMESFWDQEILTTLTE